MPIFAGMQATVTYDPEKLQLVDIAEQAYGTYTSVGGIPGTGITVTHASPGAFTLSFSAGTAQGQIWSGTATIVRFRATGTGPATVSVTM
jgi:hypothetical protein